MPLGLHLLHLCADYGGEFIVDYYDDYCKNTVVIQQFLSSHIPEQNKLSERDERTVIDVARCILNEACAAKSLWGKMAATAVFLLNRLPNKTIGGTPYYRILEKRLNLYFIWTIETHPHKGR